MRHPFIMSSGEPGRILLPQQRDRWALVREAQEMIDLNDKIQAAITRSRIDKHTLLSNHIKSRELDGKVKRAVELRQKKFSCQPSHHHSGSFSTSITTCNGASRQLNNNLDEDFEVVLDASLSKLSYDKLKNSEKSELLNEISQEVKNRLISHYMSQAHKQLNKEESRSNHCSKRAQASSHPKQMTPQQRRNYQIRPIHEQRRYDSIGTAYDKALTVLQSADKLKQEDRRGKRQRLYSQVRNPKHYYKLIGKVRCSELVQPHSLDLNTTNEVSELLELSTD